MSAAQANATRTREAWPTDVRKRWPTEPVAAHATGRWSASGDAAGRRTADRNRSGGGVCSTRACVRSRPLRVRGRVGQGSSPSEGEWLGRTVCSTPTYDSLGLESTVSSRSGRMQKIRDTAIDESGQGLGEDLGVCRRIAGTEPDSPVMRIDEQPAPGRQRSSNELNWAAPRGRGRAIAGPPRRTPGRRDVRATITFVPRDLIVGIRLPLTMPCYAKAGEGATEREN